MHEEEDILRCEAILKDGGVCLYPLTWVQWNNDNCPNADNHSGTWYLGD